VSIPPAPTHTVTTSITALTTGFNFPLICLSLPPDCELLQGKDRVYFICETTTLTVAGHHAMQLVDLHDSYKGIQSEKGLNRFYWEFIRKERKKKSIFLNLLNTLNKLYMLFVWVLHTSTLYINSNLCMYSNKKEELQRYFSFFEAEEQ